jgi:hypothetical protein
VSYKKTIDGTFDVPVGVLEENDEIAEQRQSWTMAIASLIFLVLTFAVVPASGVGASIVTLLFIVSCCAFFLVWVCDDMIDVSHRAMLCLPL